MIHKSFDQIIKQDIEALIQNQVREGRTIEYKLLLPGNTDEEKREFLADASSFANASGGDLLFGVSEIEGIPQEAIGLDCNIDSEMLRLENIIRDSIEPRIPSVRMQPIDGFPQGRVLLLRIPKSWAAPHVVSFKKSSRFFTRNSAGKYQMDVSEIRAAFLLSEALPERIRRFRDGRLARIVADEAPLPLCGKARLVFHILPIASFASDFSMDISVFENYRSNLRPVGASGWDHRFNLDGFVTYDINRQDGCCRSYCQIFRQGQIEAVWTDYLYSENGNLFIASVAYERDTIQAVLDYFGVLRNLGVPNPVTILVSMVGVLGTYMGVHAIHRLIRPTPIDRDTLILPDIMIEDYNILSDQQEVAKILRPAFDAMWNACGYRRSFNFDNQGNWNPPR